MKLTTYEANLLIPRDLNFAAHNMAVVESINTYRTFDTSLITNGVLSDVSEWRPHL
ncbi:hypothetical protein L484_012536 [Morus notabilis]|uniref:Uncharacterized protein n=1 Tax=Morus notabilis TaxID=981085 RepID=W9QJG7_9ROSA|nr:hypothetical protein L484_012536 [Morus notabilis]